MRSVLGLDIGGTKCAAVIGTADGRIIDRIAIPAPVLAADVPDALLGLLDTIVARNDTKIHGFKSLGVSYGGPVTAAGVPQTPPNLPGWREVDLRSLLSLRFHGSVPIVNDANATAMAEHRWGAGRGFRHMAFLTLGTGIGGGLILDDELYVGRDGFAGEIGHMVLSPGGPLCACGKSGCLEALASGPAIAREARARYASEAMTTEDVIALARNGDPIAVDIVTSASRWLGLGISHLLQILNLECVVLGTLAVAAADLIIPTVRAVVAEAVWPSVSEGVAIVPASLGHGAQDLAALAVALHQGS